MENKIIAALSATLREAQKQVIGYYFNPFTWSTECVVSETENIFTTIKVGGSLGMSTNHYPKDADHQIVKFPDGKCLSEMIENPVLFRNWYNDNFPK